MHILIAVNDPNDFNLRIPGVEVISARNYLSSNYYSQLKRARVINLCRSYKYQSVGYYVSLLAEARGHKPQPSVVTIQDMKSQTLARLYSEELDDLIQHSLAPIRSKTFILSIYFGKNTAKKYKRLSLHLFNLFPAPLLRAFFLCDEQGQWRLQKIGPIPASDIPIEHNDFVTCAAAEYFTGHRRKIRLKEQLRYDLAILHNPFDKTAPSNFKALQRFVKIGRDLSVDAELIEKSDFGRLAEFDALFIRETTAVNHHTYRFSRRAAAEGLVVMDDPESILKCTNKVYLAEMLERAKMLSPRTILVHRENAMSLLDKMSLPLVLKQPDGSSSLGVVKVENKYELKKSIERFLDKSEMIVAQEFVPTEFDWRVGVLGGEVLWVCKYHMAKNHWQIVQRDKNGRAQFGLVEAIAVHQAPHDIIHIATKAAALMGDGLYGVDLKQVNGKIYVIEVNDNPNIDAGFEDTILNDELYVRILDSFIRRIESRSGRHTYDARSKIASV